jgi:hypothetical protein
MTSPERISDPLLKVPLLVKASQQGQRKGLILLGEPGGKGLNRLTGIP